tara:strand:- start:904 stop:1116 length:213 start_codon:yes stop_codon:yes gene_type:complete
MDFYTVEDLANKLNMSKRACKSWLGEMRLKNPKEESLHRFVRNKQIFTTEDLGKVMKLCLRTNQEENTST